MRAYAPSIAAGLVLIALPAAAGGSSDDAIRAQAKARGVDAKIAKGTLRITGSKKADRITLRLRRRAKNTLEVDVGGSSRAEFTFSRARFGKILVRGGSGNDTVRADERNGAFTTGEKTTFQGDAGNDTLTGGRGAETFSGGAGNDTADGNGGKDSAKLGAGDDSFRWDAKDGNDKLRGDAGADRILFNGSGSDETLAAAANGARLRLTRVKEQIDADDFETLELAPLGGSDTVAVGDLTGTDVTQASIGLANRLGQAGGDARPDSVILGGGAGAETVDVTGDGSSFVVGGLPAAVSGGSAEQGIDRLTVNAGAGNDTIFNSSTGTPFAADGGEGDDTVNGGPDAEQLTGGPGNDTVDGNGGDDTVLLGDGDDTLLAEPGDGFDIAEGQAGADRVVWNGNDNSESIAVGAENGRLRVVRESTGTLDAGEFERLELNAQGGNDAVDAAGLPAGLVALALAGGPGQDTLTGSPGDDLAVGGPGNDTVVLGAGADVARWGTGDGLDTVEGQAGADRFELGGSDANEVMIASPDGPRLSLVHDGAPIASADDLEQVDFNPLGGADTVTVNNLAGTDVTQTIADLSATLGGTTGDGQLDSVNVNGTGAADNLAVDDTALGVSVTGLTAGSAVRDGDPADRLTVSGGALGDTIDASGLPAGLLSLTLDGGTTADTLIGSAGGDLVDGGPGNDTAQLGPGDDTFRWEPGDNNDVVEGQGDSDLLEFNGSNASENIDVLPNAGRLRFLRDVAGVVIDADDLERVLYNAQGGADTVNVLDMSGTDVSQVTTDLDALGGALGDGVADAVNVVGTSAANTVGIGGAAGVVNVDGLAPRVSILNGEPALDRLTVDGASGADTLDARGVTPGHIQLSLIGNNESDTLFGGAGNDTFRWDPGDGSDTIDGQGNLDKLEFNGSNANENIDVDPLAGTRARLFRDVASVTMDTTALEVIDLAVFGGSDTVTVDSMVGTALTTFNLALAAIGGGADGVADNVVVNGKTTADNVSISGAASAMAIVGFVPTISIFGPEAANDRLTFNGRGGADIINANGLAATATKLTLNGGTEGDSLFGGAGDDILNGEDGDDFLSGGPGTDTLDGGPGTDVENQ